MNHTYEKLSSNKAKLTMTVPAEQFDEATQKAYLKMRGRVNVPGFRKGKAPRKLIEKMYGEGVFYDDAFEILFPEVYEAAVTEAKIVPVDRPSVDIQEIGAGKELKFTVEVFVRPDVELGEYMNLTVTHKDIEVTDEQVKNHIAQEQEKLSRVVDITDRAVQNGDIVNLDYSGSVDGVKFDGGTADGQSLTIGSNSFIPGFEDQMVGIKLGEEKDLKVKFPKEYHAEELAGKAAVFHVKVNGIQAKELPELDDDFAQDVSDFNTFVDYEFSVREKLTETAKKNSEITLENALVDLAVKNATVDIPDAMIEEQLDYIMRDMQMRMAYQGLKMEDYLKYTGQSMEQMREMYKGEAENRVKSELVLEAIRVKEKVKPTKAEIAAQTKEQAQRSGMELEKFEESLTDKQKEYLADSAAIQKVIELMKASCKVVAPEDEGNDKPKKKAAPKAKKEAAEPKEEKKAAPAKKPRKTVKKDEKTAEA
jgi:trigger factor